MFEGSVAFGFTFPIEETTGHLPPRKMLGNTFAAEPVIRATRDTALAALAIFLFFTFHGQFLL